MEAGGIALLIAVAAGFAAAFLGAPPLAACLAQGMRREKSQARAIGSSSFTKRLLRNGITVAKPLASLLLRIPAVREKCCGVVDFACRKGYTTSPENLCSFWCTAVCALVGAGTLLAASPLFGIVAALCATAAVLVAQGRARDAWDTRLREGVPDTLRSMGVCFRAGLSLLQTFQHLSDEAKGPLKPLFLHAAHELETGGTAEGALALFRGGTAVPELAFVAVALEVQHSAGGSMQQVLDAARTSLESEIELKRSLKVQTAQAKLSAQVVTAMPFVLVAVFSLTTEDFLAPFFSSAAGLALLLLAVGMQVAGIATVRRMLRVRGG